VNNHRHLDGSFAPCNGWGPNSWFAHRFDHMGMVVSVGCAYKSARSDLDVEFLLLLTPVWR